MEQGLLIEVYRGPGPDCSLGGVSSRHDTLLLAGPGIPSVISSGDHPVVRLSWGPGRSLRLVPDTVRDRWHQFGGNFGWTSDSRFTEILSALGVTPGPVKIFDRVES